MNPHPSEPLTLDERELATRLAQLDARDGPPPALDAKILAAARAATGATSSATPRRWPAMVAIAATLALAIGVTWQLRPLPETVPARGEMQRPAAATDAARPVGPRPSPATAAPAAASPATAAPAQQSARNASESEPRRAGTTAPEAVPQRREAADIAPSNASSAPTAPVDSFPPPQPAPAFEPQAAAETDVAGEPASRQELAPRTNTPRATPLAMPAKSAVAPSPEAAASAHNPALAAADRAPVTSARPVKRQSAESRSAEIQVAATIADLPVGSDSALPPPAWLERIRQRRDVGDLQAARESLRQFRRAWPRIQLPDDLRALADAAGQ